MGDALFCPNCGTRQEGSPKFCFACGADLSAIVAKRSGAQSEAPVPAAPTAPLPLPAAPQSAPVAPQPVAPAHAVAPPPPAPAAAPAAPPSWSVPSNQRQYQGPAPIAGQPAGTGPQPRSFATARPTGITILAVLEVIGGVLGLWGGKLILDVVDARNYYFGDGGTYQLFGLASIAGAICAFVLAWGLWELRPWAWMLGVALCLATGAINLLVALVVNGNDTIFSSALNVGIDAAILYYLNLNSTRAIFGRPPTTMLQPAPGSGIPGSAMPPAPGAGPMPPAFSPTPPPPPPAGAQAAPPWAQPPVPGPAQTPPPPWAQPNPPRPPSPPGSGPVE